MSIPARRRTLRDKVESAGFSVEWNHGYLRLYVGDGGFFVSLRIREKEEVEQLWESSVM